MLRCRSKEEFYDSFASSTSGAVTNGGGGGRSRREREIAVGDRNIKNKKFKMESPSFLMTSSSQRYAAAALLSLALRHAQIHQSRPIKNIIDNDDDDDTNSGNRDEDSDCSHFWTHKSHGLLRPVFQFLEIDSKAWPGLEKMAAASVSSKDHISTLLRIISEEDNESSSERANQERVLAEAVDSTAARLESASAPAELTKHEFQNIRNSETMHETSEDTCNRTITSQSKVALLFELLSACVADTPQENNESPRINTGYDARHRTSLRLLATWLDVKWIKVEAMEMMLTCSAMAALKEDEEQSDEPESENHSWSKWKRGGIIGAAALTGGTLMAITGGLAAPAIAAGFSALAPTLGSLVPIIGTSGFAAVASAAGSATGSVAVAASFGAAGAGLSGSKMARRIGSIEEFEFKFIGENHSQGRLAVGILISGFISEEEDFIRPWERTNENLERYALQWESKNLIAVSSAIEDWLKSKLTLEMMKHGAMMTVLSSLVSALAWPTTLLSAIDFIDSKWSIAIDRSDKAGILLAEVLSKNLHGNRPVTLIGFSLGARVIFKCLQQLAESGKEGIVERVVLLGAPISSKDQEWESVRKIVAGRFVNVFSTNDWILGVTYRASLLSQGLAGIQAIDVAGIENVDATHLIDGHSSYLWAMEKILKLLELDCNYPVTVSAPVKYQENQ